MMKGKQALVLGIGNLLWADEGFGIRAVEEFYRHYQCPDNVEILDGGTQGIYLVQRIRDCDILIVFDAIDYGLEPGALKVVEGEEVPCFLGAKKMSLHQTGFQEVIAMAEMMGERPDDMVLIGVQPVELEDFGGSLRDAVRAQIPTAIEIAIEKLAAFGIEVTKRPAPLPEEAGIGCQVMTDSHYTNDRPPEDQAFRHGDARVLVSDNWQGPEDYDAELEAILGQEGGA